MAKTKKVKREEALARQKERQARGDRGQLQKLVDEGHGHTREAQRLMEKLGLQEIPAPNRGSPGERQGKK